MPLLSSKTNLWEEDISLEDYTKNFFMALGTRMEEHSEDILRVELTRKQLCDIEDRPWDGWYVQTTVPDLSTFYFTFNEESKNDAVQSEYLSKYSWRLAQFLETAIRIGKVSRMRVVPSDDKPGLKYKPIIIFGFFISLISSQQWSFLLPVAVDMITGLAGIEMAQQIFKSRLDEGPVKKGFRLPRELTFKQAFEIAGECVKESLCNDSGIWEWYHKAQKRYEEEAEGLDKYYLTLRSEGRDEIEQNHQKDLKAIKARFWPRITASPSLALLLYSPI